MAKKDKSTEGQETKKSEEQPTDEILDGAQEYGDPEITEPNQDASEEQPTDENASENNKEDDQINNDELTSQEAEQQVTEATEESRKSTVSMQTPEGIGGVSFGGETFYPDKDGIVEIPAENVNTALDNGLMFAPEGKKKGK